METFNLDDSTPPPNGAVHDIPSDETPKRRGRPRGSKNRAPLEEQAIGPNGETKTRKPRRKKMPPVDTVKLAKQVHGMHWFVGAATGLPELQLTEQESVMLAESLASVSQEYGIALSGKTAATLQLFATAAIIYLPRLAKIDEKIKAKKRNKPVTVDGEKVDGTTAAN